MSAVLWWALSILVCATLMSAEAAMVWVLVREGRNK